MELGSKVHDTLSNPKDGTLCAADLKQRTILSDYILTKDINLRPRSQVLVSVNLKGCHKYQRQLSSRYTRRQVVLTVQVGATLSKGSGAYI